MLKNHTFHSLRAYGSQKSVKKIRDQSLLITENYTASGYVDHHVAQHIYNSVLSELQQSQEQLILGKKNFIQKNRSPLDRIIKIFSNGATETIIFPDQDVLTHLEYLLEPNSEFLWALKELQAYCIEHKTGFIEASDIVVPIIGEFRGYDANLRAQFLTYFSNPEKSQGSID